MGPRPLTVYLAILLLGLFLLPMAPAVSSNASKITEGIIGTVSHADKNNLPSETPDDDALDAILNPFNLTCYDWRGEIIPCHFTQRYVGILFHKPMPVS